MDSGRGVDQDDRDARNQDRFILWF